MFPATPHIDNEFGRAWIQHTHVLSQVVAVPKVLFKITENSSQAIILSQILYWHGISTETGKPRLQIVDGAGRYWLAKNRADWEDECGIKPKTAHRALNWLENAGLIDRQLHGFKGNVTPWIAINWEAFQRAIESLSSTPDNLSGSNTDTTTNTTTDTLSISSENSLNAHSSEEINIKGGQSENFSIDDSAFTDQHFEALHLAASRPLRANERTKRGYPGIEESVLSDLVAHELFSSERNGRWGITTKGRAYIYSKFPNMYPAIRMLTHTKGVNDGIKNGQAVVVNNNQVVVVDIPDAWKMIEPDIDEWKCRIQLAFPALDGISYFQDSFETQIVALKHKLEDAGVSYMDVSAFGNHMKATWSKDFIQRLRNPDSILSHVLSWKASDKYNKSNPYAGSYEQEDEAPPRLYTLEELREEDPDFEPADIDALIAAFQNKKGPNNDTSN